MVMALSQVKVVTHSVIGQFLSISYRESSGSLVRGWVPGETLGYCNFSYRRISTVKQCKPLRGSQ